MTTKKESVEETPVAELQEEVVEKKSTKKTAAKSEPKKDTKAANPKAVKEETPVKEEKTAEKTTQEETPAEPVSNNGDAQTIEDPLKDFDWATIDTLEDEYSADERDKLEKMYSDTLNSINESEVIEGTVVSMNKREVVINIGYKSEGIVSRSEFRYNSELEAGTKVDVYVEIQEDKNGQLVLSHSKARALKAWDNVNDALTNDEIITGYVKCRTKGGLIVDVFGIEAFLPGSQIDVKPVRDYDMYVNKNMEFKVVKINKEFKNVVVSHKALIESELKEQRKEIISKLEKGQVLEGMVKNITSYGVFIDLGGVDGLVHITDLSWGRISHPEEIVQVDQKLNVVILDFDENKTRIQLGLKQLSDHPWDELDEKLEPGKKVKGKVVVVADYGAFVEIAPGIEGLIHVSEMSWSQHLRSAQDFLKVGDEVDAEILTLDKEDRKMSLGIKQLVADPWKDVDKKYATGTKHTGTIRNFTNYGIFVELEEGVDGLIHISDLSWSKKIKHPSEFASLGETIDVVILELDMDERKVSLGHKQLEENPWDVFETVFEVGSVHKGTVETVNEKGTVVSLPHGVEGFCPSRHSVKEDGSKLNAEDSVDFSILEFSKDGKRILISHLETYGGTTKPKEKSKGGSSSKGNSMRKAMSNVRSNLEKTTLGDIDALSSLKSDLEEAENKIKAKKATKKKTKADEASDE